MQIDAPRFAIRRVDLFERPTPLRMPFRFGSTTMWTAPQAFVRVELGFPDGTRAQGVTAELMVPKWFDKDPALDNEATIAQLRRSLALAADAYRDDTQPRTAFGHAAQRLPEIVAAGARLAMPPLAAGFGAAEIDKAIADALCSHLRISFFDAVRGNALGLSSALVASVAPDLVGIDPDAALATLVPRTTLACRHTVGMADALDAGEATLDDGLPVSLSEVIAVYGSSWFKLKLGGDVDADLARLVRVAAVLDRLPEYRVTLDANEQYTPDALTVLVDRLYAVPALARLAGAVAWVEQPVSRADTFATDVAAIARRVPLMIDEADDRYGAFVDAQKLGYTGVSSKSCKGLYKSLVNRLRVARANAAGTRLFVSAEDLTAQAGLAVQQDSALAAVLGCTHAERNGHHYAFGMAAAPAAESADFLAAHGDLYRDIGGVACLDVRRGAIGLDSLAAPGFAHRACPDLSAMPPMRNVAATTPAAH